MYHNTSMKVRVHKNNLIISLFALPTKKFRENQFSDPETVACYLFWSHHPSLPKYVIHIHDCDFAPIIFSHAYNTLPFLLPNDLLLVL